MFTLDDWNQLVSFYRDVEAVTLATIRTVPPPRSGEEYRVAYGPTVYGDVSDVRHYFTGWSA